MKTEKIEFTVQRSKWRRGNEGEGLSLLLNSEGYRCCLGFLARDIGIPDEDVSGSSPASSAVPLEMDNKPNPWPHSLIEGRKIRCGDGQLVDDYINTSVCCKIIKWNDDNTSTEEQREKKLTKLFAEAGIAVTFED